MRQVLWIIDTSNGRVYWRVRIEESTKSLYMIDRNRGKTRNDGDG